MSQIPTEVRSTVLSPSWGSAAFGATAVLVSSIASIVIGMVVNIFVARMLGPDIKGRIDLIYATGSLATMVAGLSLTSGITYVVAQGNVNGRRLAGQLVGIGLIQGWAVWLSFVIISRSRFVNAFIPPEYSSWGVIGILLFMFAGLLGGYGRSFLSGFQKFVSIAVLDFFARLLTAVVTIGVLVWFRTDLNRTAIAIIVSVIAINYLAVFVVGAVIWPRLNHNNSSSQIYRVWQYSLPSYAGNLVQFANYRLDIFLVAYFVGVREVALYGIAVSIAQLLWLPSNAMQSVLFPRISHMTNDRNKAEDTAQIMRLMFVLTFIAGGILALMARSVITLLFGVRFAPSLLPLWLLLPGVVVYCIANILCGYLAGIGKPQLNFHAALVGLVVTLLLNFILIPQMGMVGAALASSISYSISTGLVLYFFVRESSLSLRHSLLLTRNDARLAFRVAHNFLQQLSSRL